MYKINPRCVMLATGEPGDKVQFAEFIQRNLQLYKMINGLFSSIFILPLDFISKRIKVIKKKAIFN